MRPRWVDQLLPSFSELGFLAMTGIILWDHCAGQYALTAQNYTWLLMWLMLVYLKRIENKLPDKEKEDAHRTDAGDGWQPPRRKTG